MLPERYCQLLTAYVDGELSDRRKQQVRRLLMKSQAARLMLRELQENAQRLHDLPRHSLDADFAMQVVAKIGDTSPACMPAAAPRPASFPTWLGLAVAAAVLFMVVGGSYLFFSSIGRSPQQLLQEDSPLALRDLDPEAFHTQLAEELKKGKGIQLELAYHDGAEAIARLSRALANNDVKLLAGQGNVKGEIRIFADSLQAEDLANIVAQLIREEQNAPQFGGVQLQALSDSDRKRVAGLLGVTDLDHIDWGDILGNSEDDKASIRKGLGKPKSATPSERSAVMLAGRAGQGSEAVQQFFASRSAPRPGTFPLVLILRPASA